MNQNTFEVTATITPLNAANNDDVFGGCFEPPKRSYQIFLFKNLALISINLIHVQCHAGDELVSRWQKFRWKIDTKDLAHDVGTEANERVNGVYCCFHSMASTDPG